MSDFSCFGFRISSARVLGTPCFSNNSFMTDRHVKVIGSQTVRRGSFWANPIRFICGDPSCSMGVLDVLLDALLVTGFSDVSGCGLEGSGTFFR